MRLDKYVMNALQISKNDAKKIIRKKAITVDGKTQTSSDYQVSDNAQIYYNDQKLVYKENIYIMMNKPKGTVCANYDNRFPTVMDLITEFDTNKLSTVGRLDIDTTGLLLITSDGAFIHDLTSPKKHKEKEYIVTCDKPFTSEDVEKAKEGIWIIEDGKDYQCKEAKLKILDNCKASICITEGKFHQIKKMCKALGKEVLELTRIRIGNLYLDSSLELGMYRELKEEEINNL